MDRANAFNYGTRRGVWRRLPVLAAVSAAVGCCVLAIRLPVAANASPRDARSAAESAASPASLDAIRYELRSSRASQRREALLKLTDLGEAAEPSLPDVWPLVRDADPLVRIYAARTLWLVGNRSDIAVAAFSEMAGSGLSPADALATFLLGEIGPAAAPAQPALESELAATDPILRLQAAEALLKIDPSHSPPHEVLLESLAVGPGQERYFAACALVSAGAKYASAADAGLLRAMTDDDQRIASAAAIVRLCCQNDIRHDTEGHLDISEPEGNKLTQAEVGLLIRQLADSNVLFRRRAAGQLALLGPAAKPAVTALRESLADEDPLVCVWSALALRHCDPADPRIVPTLIDLVGTTSPNAGTLAVSELGEWEPRAIDALPALYDLLDSSAPLARLHVALTLNKIDPHAREPVVCLCEALHSADSDVRYLAALALAEVSLPHHKRAARELTSSLGDRNLRVRSAAARSWRTLALVRAQVRAGLTQVQANTADVRAVERQGAIANEAESAVVPANRAEDRPEAAVSEGETVAASPPADAHRSDRSASLETLDRLAADSSGDHDWGEIPVMVAQAEQPQAEAVQQPPHHPGWYDWDEETIEQHKAVGQLRARITPPEGDFPIDHATPHFAQYPTYLHGLGATRGFAAVPWSWEPTAVCYAPLWFQDINLERYGLNYGCLQTAVSAVKFYADCALLPYKLVAESPCDCVYTLGYDRPGNCVPYRCYRLPWRTDAALFIGGVATGLIFLAP
ncbi:MAG: hypothetical protein ACT4QC_07045 [Planctomycetaceae bacterium]